MNKEKRTHLKIKDYVHWSLFLHQCQSYLGWVYLLIREDQFRDFIEINTCEREEFFLIGKKIKIAFRDLFYPDKVNYAALSNKFQKLHVHFIPRYKTKRFLLDVEFIDDRWGKNYAPYNKSFKVDPNIMLHIRNQIKARIDMEL